MKFDFGQLKLEVKHVLCSFKSDVGYWRPKHGDFQGKREPINHDERSNSTGKGTGRQWSSDQIYTALLVKAPNRVLKSTKSGPK